MTDPLTYLAGPIIGQSDAMCHDWRNLATRILGNNNVRNPMRRDFRGKEELSVADIVEQDTQDILDCDIVLAYVPFATIGTSMEIHLAYECDKEILVVVPEGGPESPWLTYHATACYESLEPALTRILLGNQFSNGADKRFAPTLSSDGLPA